MPPRVLITGCSRGIGRALAREFAERGWQVCATARQVASLEDLPVALALPLEVTEDVSVTSAAREVAAAWPSLDLLINNAAVFPGDGGETLEECDLAWFGEAFAANVTGVALVTRAFLPLLRAASDGSRVVNISSGAGSISEKDDFAYYPYSVSKAALNMLTRAMAAEFRKQNIVVTALSPGWVRTEMGGEHAPLTPEESARSLFRTITALGREQAGGFFGRDGEPYAW